jgi:hypothetical protein
LKLLDPHAGAFCCYFFTLKTLEPTT